MQAESFARRVADRYPWVRRYTIINEPLTTARFSALYGHWYPHAQDDGEFVRALVHQCRAIVEGMAAVRRVRPDAELVQTEDISATTSPPSLRRQAKFCQERRWLSLDLLCGRVTSEHFLWPYLHRFGFTEAERDFWIKLDDLAHDMCNLLQLLECSARSAEMRVPEANQAVTAKPAKSANRAGSGHGRVTASVAIESARFLVGLALTHPVHR